MHAPVKELQKCPRKTIPSNFNHFYVFLWDVRMSGTFAYHYSAASSMMSNALLVVNAPRLLRFGIRANASEEDQELCQLRALPGANCGKSLKVGRVRYYRPNCRWSPATVDPASTMGHAPDLRPRSARKRSRSRSGSRSRDFGPRLDRPAKHPKRGPEPADAVVKHGLLAQYYPEIQTLRQYALSKLPPSSRIRRRRIASLGLGPPSPERPCTEEEAALGELLDSTIVTRRQQAEANHDHRWEQWAGFSQKGDESYVTLSDGLKGSIYSQSEIVDFAVWVLFSRESVGSWPKHLLCDGFRRQACPNNRSASAAGITTTIPGLCSIYPNQHVQTLKASPWPQLLMQLGKEGERIMIGLLLDCAIFRPVKAGKGNFHQLSGIPLSELEPLMNVGDKGKSPPTASDTKNVALRPSDISFVRSRMLYARAALNAQGLVHFGLRHIPLPDRHDEGTIHVMMYMFPRQFGLHNVFTSAVDRQQTAQKFHDYTLREEEIKTKFPPSERGATPRKHVSNRLRGKAMHLVQRFRVFHARCSYAEMLHHYCPVPAQVGDQRPTLPASSRTLPSSSRSSAKPAKGGKRSRPSAAPVPNLQYAALTELATPITSVSAFCQAVVVKVIPNEFWGQGPTQEHNKACFLRKVHHFIHLRRFESMCLHEVMQGMKVSNFYVTESTVDRYRLFFFRHDVWRYVAEPAMAALKTSMFEEVKTEDALRILQSRRLAYSQVRLLPKQNAMRPIMNLRRRTLLKGGPVNSMLKLEKSRNPDRLGSSLFSVGDIYQRMKAFKGKLGGGNHTFYFAKVDVQAAFDTIPQRAMVDLLKHIPRQTSYKMLRHAEIALPESASDTAPEAATKPIKRWHTTAKANNDTRSFPEVLESSLAAKKKHTVFVDSAVQRARDTGELLALTAAHIEQNLVRIGKKYYRQKAGIPQGSVLSSTLCNYFYADLERTQLAFLLQAEDCLLLRLIDDFLLITTDRGKASRFVDVMHRGVPEYGVAVNPGKSLVNFPLRVRGTDVPRVEDRGKFPYCGLLIDCGTLAVTKQREAGKGSAVFNSLTVEYSRCPGRNFKRKILNPDILLTQPQDAFKIQSHLLFFDTSHNSHRGVRGNIYAGFVETATKMWAYARCMPGRPGTALLVDTIKTLIDVAFVLLTSRARKERYPGQVLIRKQTGYTEVIAWLEEETRKLSGRKGLDVEGLVAVAKKHPVASGSRKLKL
ncbi:hypothetical protein N657DRAFT_629813 [Parathielavia appendiculata]|uniref:Telomerase reverse transcriptase n=1 Tax=Parathielavia appendiculata TaxID=2587402 RepID=A0AAN6U9S0_9PEZI|nr:hypothetical protein N657DRAFT_629813 [Parathielavia appendiculata]